MNIREEAELIREIQTFLLEISYAENWNPRVKIDGIYESETELAVRTFQASREIPATGEVDSVTYTALYTAYLAARPVKEEKNSV